MTEQTPFRGWAPVVSRDLPLSKIIDLAFDYRGNTTIVRKDGSSIDGYVFNRDAQASEPFIEIYDTQGSGPFTILYTEIDTIKFTGRDTAFQK